LAVQSVLVSVQALAPVLATLESAQELAKGLVLVSAKELVLA